MLLREERELVVEYGKEMIYRRLSSGTFGNISVYNAEQDLFAISPSGMDYFKTDPEDVVVMSPDGKIWDGARKPSSESDMHRIFYQRRKGIHAVVHTHSKYATTLATMGWTIPPLHFLVAYGGKEIPCSPIEPSGSYELAEAAFQTMGERYACLLGNHGLLACGHDISYAMDTAEQVEFCAELYYRTKTLGEPRLLKDHEIAEALNMFQTYRKK